MESDIIWVGKNSHVYVLIVKKVLNILLIFQNSGWANAHPAHLPLKLWEASGLHTAGRLALYDTDSKGPP